MGQYLDPNYQRYLLGAWYSILGQEQQPPYGPNMRRGPYGNPYGGSDYRYLMGQEAAAAAAAPALVAPPVVAPAPMFQPPPPGPMIPPPMAMPPMAPPPPMPAYRIPPRNVLIEQAPPSQAVRIVLPMSTGCPILPTQSAQITARSQMGAFRPERIFISAAGTSGGAADWVVNDCKIGNRSQFAQSGDVPGDMFATNAIDGFVSFETVQTAMDVVLVVTYIGLNESGCPFFGAMVGTAAI